jgi:hypothetical protein
MKKEAYNKLQEDLEDIFFHKELAELKKLATRIQNEKPKSLKEVFFGKNNKDIKQ